MWKIYLKYTKELKIISTIKLKKKVTGIKTKKLLEK